MLIESLSQCSSLQEDNFSCCDNSIKAGAMALLSWRKTPSNGLEEKETLKGTASLQASLVYKVYELEWHGGAADSIDTLQPGGAGV